ncbi:MAG: precorrin-3B synthase [Paracoccus sp. (in: a-proteobacteria)]|uniref:precorrin-3B synthase n=1 Tax=Paracoccus sp. TaxID=267 RepID=UPI0026E0AF37|nr:precorrin-3B synthase [Paracoccus sp. (in: a-proteobacteria)]MDO5620992.1 precorrin-3B synthase [Paracoccus sp. (in: a-proteobacteria)]
MIPVIQGWCPGALRPMMSGDGLVVRVRTRNGFLPPDQARAIAALSRDFGNGLMDVTSRANLQLRGVTPDSHPHVLDGLRQLGLLDADPQVESRRNVILSPFAAQDSAAWGIAARLTDLLAAQDAPQTPAKFGYAVDDRGCLADTPCDIRITLTPQGWRIAPDGAEGSLPAGDDPAGAALDLARWFVKAGVSNGRGRMRNHPALDSLPLEPVLPEPMQPHIGPVENGSLIGLPFGQITPDQLEQLASHGPIRLTPWRMLLTQGTANGLITDPADPLLRVTACTGAPGCPQALSDTRGHARRLAPQLAPGETLHISGCPKRCASQAPHSRTLIATGPDQFQDFFFT